MIRRALIVDNYLAIIFIMASGFLGYLITRGQGFEVHFTVSLISLALSITSHLGSGTFFALKPADTHIRIPMVVLNYIAAGLYLWATYAGFQIRQGVPFDFHFVISMSGFFVSLLANVLSALFLVIKYRPTLEVPGETQA